MRKTREETPAKKVEGNKIVTVSSSQLKKGDVFVCEAGDVIPSDGEIIEGLASIDESAITGESAPVIREAGGDKEFGNRRHESTVRSYKGDGDYPTGRKFS